MGGYVRRLTRRDNYNALAHFPLIRVFAVLERRYAKSLMSEWRLRTVGVLYLIMLFSLLLARESVTGGEEEIHGGSISTLMDPVGHRGRVSARDSYFDLLDNWFAGWAHG